MAFCFFTGKTSDEDLLPYRASGSSTVDVEGLDHAADPPETSEIALTWLWGSVGIYPYMQRGCGRRATLALVSG